MDNNPHTRDQHPAVECDTLAEIRAKLEERQHSYKKIGHKVQYAEVRERTPQGEVNISSTPEVDAILRFYR